MVIWFSIYSVIMSEISGLLVFIYSVTQFRFNGPVSSFIILVYAKKTFFYDGFFIFRTVKPVATSPSMVTTLTASETMSGNLFRLADPDTVGLYTPKKQTGKIVKEGRIQRESKYLSPKHWPHLKPNMSVFAFLPVVFYKNVFVFLGLVIFCKNVLSYFMNSYCCEQVILL